MGMRVLSGLLRYVTMNKYDLPVRAGHVHRWAGRHLVGKRSSIAEHSYEVAMYSLFILEDMHELLEEMMEPIGLLRLKSQVLEYSLLHDIPEVFTGDVPFPVKAEFPELKFLLAKIEKEFMRAALPEFDLVYQPLTYLIVKAADILAVFREIDDELEYSENEHFLEGRENAIEIFKNLFIKHQDLPVRILVEIETIMRNQGVPRISHDNINN